MPSNDHTLDDYSLQVDTCHRYITHYYNTQATTKRRDNATRSSFFSMTYTALNLARGFGYKAKDEIPCCHGYYRKGP